MDIDLAALRALERERGITLDVLIPAIEQALLLAYQRTDGHYRHARAELDRKTGHVVIWAREENEVPAPEGEVDEEGNPARPRRELGPEFDDTPTGFGRVAAATARQVIVQRLRDIEDEAILGDFRAGRATSSPGSSSRAPTRGTSRSTSAPSRASSRSPSRCPGRATSTASGCAASSSPSSAACAARRSACRAPTPTSSRSSSRSRCPRSPTAASRSRRWPARPATAPRSRCTPPCRGSTPRARASGPMGARVRAVMSELHGEKIDIVDFSEDPATFVAAALSPARVSSVEIVDRQLRAARVVVPDYQLSLAIGREGQNARLAAKLTGLADRHPSRHRGRRPRRSRRTDDAPDRG